MGSTFLSLHYHLIFSTKDRRPLIRDSWLPDLHGYLGGAVRGLGGLALAIGGVADHVHLLVGLRATHCLADFVRELKKASSVWASTHEREFHWQDGYGAFAVSHSHCEAVSAYIRSQAEHHQKVDFVGELRRLLERNGVAYNADYLL